MSKDDAVDHPAHYGGESNLYEAIKVIEAWRLNFSLGNAVKYIARAGKKPGSSKAEDLKKAQWYLKRALFKLGEAEPPKTPKRAEPPQGVENWVPAAKKPRALTSADLDPKDAPQYWFSRNLRYHWPLLEILGEMHMTVTGSDGGAVLLTDEWVTKVNWLLWRWHTWTDVRKDVEDAILDWLTKLLQSPPFTTQVSISALSRTRPFTLQDFAMAK